MCFRQRYRKWLSLLSVCNTYNVDGGGWGRRAGILHLNLTGPVQSYFFFSFSYVSIYGFPLSHKNTHPSEECCSSCLFVFFNCIVLRHSWGCNNRLPNEISFFFLAFYLLSIHELIIADIFLLYVWEKSINFVNDIHFSFARLRFDKRNKERIVYIIDWWITDLFCATPFLSPSSGLWQHGDGTMKIPLHWCRLWSRSWFLFSPSKLITNKLVLCFVV